MNRRLAIAITSFAVLAAACGGTDEPTIEGLAPPTTADAGDAAGGTRPADGEPGSEAFDEDWDDTPGEPGSEGLPTADPQTGSDDADEPVVHENPSREPGDPDGPQARPVTPRPGQKDARPTAWESYEHDEASRELTLFFWSGVEPCHVLDRVEVEYGSDRITVTLWEGSDPAAGEDVACIELAEYKQVTVVLDEDLGVREVLDGARA